MVTVNLTTTRQRLQLCRISVTSLLMQSRCPDGINLWISSGPYLSDSGVVDSQDVEDFFNYLPEEARQLVSVRWVKNTGPYRKLIPILREASAVDIIVTADDDIFYGEYWLQKLLSDFYPENNTMVAARVREKRYNIFGKKTSYLFWDLITQSTTIDDDYVVTFGGGAVLMRSMFQEQDIMDDAYLSVAPTADDLWYSKLLRRNGVKIRVLSDALKELNFIEHDSGLKNNNNLPVGLSFLHELKMRIWNGITGRLGAQVCGNDEAYSKIEEYFSRGSGADLKSGSKSV
ncbi:MAG: hypothetical protein ACI9LY_001256 [Arenicella sp.]